MREPPTVRVSRQFQAARRTVFAAWSSAEHVKAWFSPKTYSVAEARVEMRVGGAFEVCMVSLDGERHWSRGTFVAVSPDRSLAIETQVEDREGRALFRADTEVVFAEVEGGTRIDVVQRYAFLDPAMAAPMVAGAAEGWRTTLDKLEQEVGRMGGGV